MNTIIGTRSRRFHLSLAVGVTAALLAACGTQQEGTSASGSAESDCANADQAQAQYKQAWSETADQLGLDKLEPTDEKVCEVDTSKWAAKPKSGGCASIRDAL